jgi:arylsulfatase A-like enzyme
MNIVTLIIDTLRYDYLGANGNPDVHTPNLDRLAEQSWNFDRAFAASFPTIPHRTDVMLGRYGAPFHPWQPLDVDKPSIPRALADVGYCTQLIHDTPHLVNGGHSFDYPFHAWMPVRGAEVDRGWITDDWGYLDNWCDDPLFDGFFEPGMDSLRQGWPGLTAYVGTNRHRKRDEDWNAAQLFLTASRFLKDNATRDNFFLWVDCFDPHEPWDAPPELMRLYDTTPGYDGRLDPRSFIHKVRNNPELPPAAVARIKAAYAAKVSLVDKWLGVFLDTLDETGLAKNTAILLTADHGTNVGDRPGQPFGKSAPPRANESHVPFLVHVPDGGSGRSDAIVQPQDVFATLAAIGGAAVPDTLESHDVLGIVQAGAEERREIALAGGAVGFWRGAEQVLFSAYDKEWRLGVAADPAHCQLERLGTQEDVAADHPDVVERLRAAAVEEIIRRGLDPQLAEWLRTNGQGEVPKGIRVTDAHPAPPTWRSYFGYNYTGP